jgi:diguanylate cyclase (GGDEF)-like protein
MLLTAVGLFLVFGSWIFVYFKKESQQSYRKIKADIEVMENAHAKICLRKEKNEREIFSLNQALARTIKMYETARDICISLDEDRLFARFKEDLKKIINYEECFLVAEDGFDPQQYPLETVFSLSVHETHFGYLVIKGVAAPDHGPLSILAGHFALGLKRAKLFKMTQELAITDSLTGLYTRRYAIDRFKGEFERSEAHGMNLSFLMIDVDDFKECNDEYGHLVGDAVLCEIANRIKENIREIDLLARFGGEEFMVVAPNTPKEGAVAIAERIRKGVEESSIRAYDEVLKVTVSIGLASYPADIKSVEGLMTKADEALYQAKKSGKNKVSVF